MHIHPKTAIWELKEMLGIADPWIWGGYIVAFGLIVFSMAYAWLKKDDGDGQ